MALLSTGLVSTAASLDVALLGGAPIRGALLGSFLDGSTRAGCSLIGGVRVGDAQVGSHCARGGRGQWVHGAGFNESRRACGGVKYHVCVRAGRGFATSKHRITPKTAATFGVVGSGNSDQD